MNLVNKVDNKNLRYIQKEVTKFIPIEVHINPQYFNKYVKPFMESGNNITGILIGTNIPYFLDASIQDFEIRRRYPLHVVDLELNVVYGSPLATTRWKVTKITEENVHLVAEDNPNMKISCEKDRFVMWVNGDNRHNQY